MRHTKPEFGLTEVSSEEDKARAQRLALFFTTIEDSPETSAMTLQRNSTVSSIVRRLFEPPFSNIAREQGSVDDLNGEDRIIYATGLILHHQDDMIAEPDTETAAVMRREIQKNTQLGNPFDRRVLRLRIVAEQLAELNISGTHIHMDPRPKAPEAGAA